MFISRRGATLSDLESQMIHVPLVGGANADASGDLEVHRAIYAKTKRTRRFSTDMRRYAVAVSLMEKNAPGGQGA